MDAAQAPVLVQAVGGPYTCQLHRTNAMRHRITPLLLLVITLAGSCILLGACGQKGPLYLPEEPEQTEN